MWDEEMSFATHRMRPPDTTKQITESANVVESKTVNFFSNSGLIDYHSGANLTVKTASPPSGPITGEITSIKFEPIHSKEVNAKFSCSAEESARAIAKQITNSYATDLDSDQLQMQSEFKSLSSKKKPISFEKWVGSDINRKLMSQSGADAALRSQYSKLCSNFKAAKVKTVQVNAEVQTNSELSTWSCDKEASIDSRLSAVEEHVENMTVGLEDHTYHIKMLKDGMTNHTTSLKKVVDGMHNHTAALKTLSTPDTGLDSSKIMKKYAVNSAMKQGKSQLSSEQMLNRVNGKN